MTARSLETTRDRLSSLRVEALEDAALGSLALALSLVATRVAPGLAVPLLLGGLTALCFAVRSYWRRWDLIDGLLLDREAYAIADVRSRGERSATLENRRMLADSARRLLVCPCLSAPERVRSLAVELEKLADDLDDRGLLLDPTCAVACERLLTDASTSPLLNAELPVEDARARLLRIEAGFDCADPGT